MISSDFYHTGETTVIGNLVITDDIKSCADIIDNTSDYAYPYYMGYLDYGQMPISMHIGKWELEDATLLKFSETNVRNHGWGLGVAASSYGSPVGGLIYLDTNVLKYHPASYFDVNTAFKFINSAYMASTAYANAVNVFGYGVIVPEADIDENGSAYGYSNSGVYNFFSPSITCAIEPGTNLTQNIKDFIDGNASIDFGTTNVDGETINLQFDVADFGEDCPIASKYFEVNGVNYVLYFAIQGYSYPSYGKYRVDDNTMTEINIVPFIEYDDPTGQGLKWYMFNHNATPSNNLAIRLDDYYGIKIESVYISGYEMYNNWYLGDYWVEGKEIYGTLDPSSPQECWWYRNGASANSPGWGRTGIIRGRHIFTSDSGLSGTFRIRTMVKPKDIYNNYILFHKIDTLNYIRIDVNTTTSYRATDSTALFYSDNKPKNERIEEAASASMLEKL